MLHILFNTVYIRLLHHSSRALSSQPLMLDGIQEDATGKESHDIEAKALDLLQRAYSEVITPTLQWSASI